MRFGKPLGTAIIHLITIVTPRSFYRWVSGEKRRRSASTAPPPRRTPGRPRTAIEIERIILRMARENTWGATRIHGELKKLGLAKVSVTTIVNILRRNGFGIDPLRGPNSWDAFIKRHAKTLWCCDFLSKKVLTLKGMKEAYVPRPMPAPGC